MSLPAAAPAGRIPRPVLVCFAVEQEASPFRPLVRGASDISVLVTGMGRQNAEAALRRSLATAKPRVVLTCGFAGGLDPALRCGDIVHDADDSLASALVPLRARAGRFYCAGEIAVTAGSKRELRGQTRADAVEMESGVIRDVCRHEGIASATIRVVLDSADEDLPLDFNAVTTAEMKIDPAKLALALARAPGKIPALLRFQKQTRTAAELLAQALQQALGL